MRDVSQAAREAMNAPETGALFTTLVAVTNGTDVYRFCDAGHAVTSNGHEYLPFPFRVDLPDDVPNRAPRVRARICNVDRSLVPFFRSLTRPGQFEVRIVLADSPDRIEWGPFAFTMRSYAYDADEVEVELSLEDFVNEPYPADKVTPAAFPGAFR